MRLTRNVRFALGATSASALLLLSAAGPAAASATTRWGTAIEVPGLAALSAQPPFATLNAISCGASGSCAAGGSYFDKSGVFQAFVVDETGGVWGNAIEVPGTAALNVGPGAEVLSVSCASAGNCVLGGDFSDSAGNLHAFVDSESGGTWGQAIEVPGSFALTNDGFVEVEHVSCPRGDAGDCALSGRYSVNESGKSHQQAFVDSETGGTWGQAEQVPGTGPSSGHGAAFENALSCSSAGDCLLGGDFNSTAWIATDKNGVWGHYQPVPGLSALNTKFDSVSTVSCTAAADCSAGGFYTDSAGNRQAFVVTKHNGVWGKALEVPGSGALNAGGSAALSSVDCTSAGNCSAVGGYASVPGPQTQEPFVVSQVRGTWGQAIAAPGIAALDNGNGSSLVQVSCISKGYCSAAGSYNLDASGLNDAALVIDQTGGVWQPAAQVPGTAALNATTSQVTGVSCPPTGRRFGNCSLGGGYGGVPGSPDSSFVDSQR